MQRERRQVLNQAWNQQLAQRQLKMIQTAMCWGHWSRHRRDSKKEAEPWRGGMRPFENEKRFDTRVRDSELWARLRKREALRELKLSTRARDR